MSGGSKHRRRAGVTMAARRGAVRFRARSSSSPGALSRSDFSLELIPLGDVQGLRFLEFNQQCPRSRGIEAIALQLGHDLALTRDVVRTKLDLFLSLGQAPQEGLVVDSHGNTINYRVEVRALPPADLAFARPARSG